ncbi:MAG: hypothetical protein R3E68_19640 [Burkholderiaceae bacterium]
MSGGKPPASPPPFRERLRWDAASGEIRDGEVRYLMLRHDALMGMFRAMAPEHRGPALLALADSITHHGGQSARKYQAMEAADGARLLAVIAATAPQLGWGLWEVVDPGPGLVRIRVRNSPFAVGWRDNGLPRADTEGVTSVCAAIVGMLRVVGQMVAGGPVQALEAQCACEAHHADCVFEIRPITSKA